MKQQAIILSVIALATTVIARPLINFSQNSFTLTGQIFTQNPNNQSERLYKFRNKEEVNFRLHIDPTTNTKLQVIERVNTQETYYAYAHFGETNISQSTYHSKVDSVFLQESNILKDHNADIPTFISVLNSNNNTEHVQIEYKEETQQNYEQATQLFEFQITQNTINLKTSASETNTFSLLFDINGVLRYGYKLGRQNVIFQFDPVILENSPQYKKDLDTAFGENPYIGSSSQVKCNLRSRFGGIQDLALLF
ncbi:UNKNOWN [Stylonychia lemnae]|uniref:Glycoside hydrolase 131 catalytic N-terminal domain-containing protein n=1 Tax=Stylonychia lemnae TaxID=5949 RepID=A0A078A0E3_STYLE|nr:UNKNOWN [Stylonychia lemnae]|eukprot:CDW74913.1 UNKNOWN [Stylonychia lemnae]